MFRTFLKSKYFALIILLTFVFGLSLCDRGFQRCHSMHSDQSRHESHQSMIVAVNPPKADDSAKLLLTTSNSLNKSLEPKTQQGLLLFPFLLLFWKVLEKFGNYLQLWLRRGLLNPKVP